MERTYKIFGKGIKLNTIDSKEGDILHQELSLYPIIDNNKFDISINYSDRVNTDKSLSINPSLHYFNEQSIVCRFGVTLVRFSFEKDQLKQIDFSINKPSTKEYILQKWKSMQYTSNRESIGQIFHELILVPAAFFIDNYSVIHSSGIVNKNGEVVLFGGTGGVGKTSLEMSLCLDDDISFFNDDIGILDSDGNCFPNFSYPKIYGYNLQGETKLKKKILQNSGILNKLHYKYRSFKGLNKVRRRVRPETLYGGVYSDSKKISSFIILFRSDTSGIKLERISAEKASELNNLIIYSEYKVLLNHLSWHEYNASSLDISPVRTTDFVMEKNLKSLESGLRNSDDIYLAHIPLTISNKDFKQQIKSILSEKEII